jgi:glycosyltransferase involved in cell wall biosynthesis
MRILFLARALGMGGAERQLVALARGLRRGGHDVAVAVFYGGGEFEAELREEGIPLHDLAKGGRWSQAGFLVRLCRLVRNERPEIVHSYLDSPNLVAAAVKRIFPSVKVIWGIRSAMDDFRGYDRVCAMLERIASPFVDGIITNSEAGRRRAVAAGLDGRNMSVIPNGIDCERFRPDAAGRERLRREWGVADDTALVGMVARLDRVKNHANFLRAAAAASAVRADVRYVCLGGGPSGYRSELQRLAGQLGVEPWVTWLGERRVTKAEYSALDVAVLSSDEGEGFPNVLAEAMACGRPVVATDSGDARAIVGDAGTIVPPRDPAALGRGIVDVLERVRTSAAALSCGARRRVEEHYSIEALVSRTVQTLERARSRA